MRGRSPDAIPFGDGGRALALLLSSRGEGFGGESSALGASWLGLVPRRPHIYSLIRDDIGHRILCDWILFERVVAAGPRRGRAYPARSPDPAGPHRSAGAHCTSIDPRPASAPDPQAASAAGAYRAKYPQVPSAPGHKLRGSSHGGRKPILEGPRLPVLTQLKYPRCPFTII